MIRLFSTLFFCLACVGCATKKYSVPAGVETAQFVMAVNIERFGTTGYTTVKALTEQCKKNEDGEVLGGFTQFVNYEPNKPQEVTIRANSVFVYEFDYVAPGTQYLQGAMCWVKSAFTPEAGKKYRAEFTFSKNSCQSLLTELTPNGATIPVKTNTPICR
jgi:hypothetical protein